jgi:hypothetical protein
MARPWPDGSETAPRLPNVAILPHSIRNLSNLAPSYRRLGDDSLPGHFRCLSWYANGERLGLNFTKADGRLQSAFASSSCEIFYCLNILFRLEAI